MLCVQNLTTAATLEITSNTLLSSLQGSFSGLEVDGDTVFIKSNAQLRSLAGLEVRPSESHLSHATSPETASHSAQPVHSKSLTLLLSKDQPKAYHHLQNTHIMHVNCYCRLVVSH